MIDTAYWTIINYIVILCSFVTYFALTWIYNKYVGGKYAGALNNVNCVMILFFTRPFATFFYLQITICFFFCYFLHADGQKL